MPPAGISDLGFGVIAVGFGEPEPVVPVKPNHSPEHYREHLEECRAGDLGHFECLLRGLDGGAISLDDLGLTWTELSEFRTTALVRPAKQYVEECRGGDLGHFDDLLRWVKGNVLSFGEICVTVDEVNGFVHTANRQKGKEILEECRGGDLGNFSVLVIGYSENRFSLEDIGTTMDELEQLSRTANYETASQVAKECRAGDFARLPILEYIIHSGLFSDEEITRLDLDLDGWRRSHEHGDVSQPMTSA
ncbi:MAG: hypothetical protein WD603_01650 [Patescibacteria group bacterium]